MQASAALPRGESRVRSVAAAAPALAAAAAGLGVTVATGVILWRTFFGDPTIYYVYAKNAAAGHLFSFDPGRFSSGTTSPLWGTVLGLPYLLGGGVTGVKAFCLAISLLAVAAAVWAGVRLSGSWLGGAVGAWWVTVSLSPWGTLGYDSALSAIVFALALVVGDRLPERSERVPWRLAAVWALVPLCRPDAASLVVLQLVALLVTRRARPRPLLVAAAVAAVPAGAYALASQLVLGTWSTAATSRIFALEEIGTRWHGILYSSEAIGYLHANEVPLVCAAIGLALYWRSAGRRWVAIYGLGVLAAYPLILVVVSPVTWDVERYFLPTATAVVVGVAGLFREASRRSAGRAVQLTALALALVATYSLGTRLRVPVDFARLQSTMGYSFDQMVERNAAEIVNRVAPRGAKVLFYEVQDRYFMRPDIHSISLDGLTDPAAEPYLHPHDMLAFLRHVQPGYWIAGNAIDDRKFVQGSVLQRVYDRFKADRTLTEQRVDGIDFRIVARRTAPFPRGSTGWWQMIVRMRYR